MSINRSGRHFRRKHLAAVAATAAMGRPATGDWRSVAGSSLSGSLKHLWLVVILALRQGGWS